MDTASEKWSHGGASTTIIDTMSEPARCFSSRDSEKMKQPPATKLMAKLLSGSSCETSEQQQQPQPPPAGTKTSASPPSSNFHGKATKVKKPQDPPPSISSTSSSQKRKGGNTNTTKSRGGGNSVAGSSGARSTTASSMQPSEQRGAIEYMLANYHPGQSLSSVCSPRPPQLSSSSLPPSSSTSSRRNLPPTLHAVPTTTIVCRRDSTDPPSLASRKQFAEISISGSSWSTYEDGGGGIVAPYDPPSRDGGDSSVSTSSILRLRRQKKKKQLKQQQKKMGRSNNMASFETLNEGDEDDENGDEGDDDYVGQERRSIASNSEQHSMEFLEDGSHSTSSSDDSDAIDESAELSSAVRMELGIRKKISNNTSSTTNTNTTDYDDAEDGVSRAIVTVTPAEQQRNDNVQNNKLFLASAVNYTGLVPINSTIYEAYDHTFVSCPEDLRFRFLLTFLKKNLEKKIMIFFSTTNSAKFHAKILAHFHIPVLVMHGKQRREKFINRFFKFSDMDEGILCATDAAGRDLDIPPSVDWVIQYEPPDDPSEYILRVARISCNSDRVGRSLLFLNPGEKGFLKYYHSASIPVSEFEIPTKHLAEVQDQYEYHVNESERLCRYARDAYGSYLIAYASHGFRDVYNVHDLNKDDVGMSFGLVRGLTTPDDATADTDTLMNASSSYVGGVELGHDPMMEASKRRSNGGVGGGKRWEKKEKRTQKTWMKGEKSWPHSSIKMHPKFKGGADVPASVKF